MDCSTGVLGGARAGRCRRMRRRRSVGCTGSATRASRPSTSTSTWCGRTAFAGATAGPGATCRTGGISPGRRGAGAHRRKRPRRPLVGMMLHQDGSSHAWLPGRAPLDLVITLDDATSAIYSAMLVEEEGAVSSFLGLSEILGLDPGIAAKGLFSSLYTDRGSHYFHTPQAGGPVAKACPDPGGAGAGAARDRAHPGLLAGGARPLRAGLPHASGPAAEGARARRDRHGGGGQRLPPRALPAGPQRPLRDGAGRGGLGLRAGCGGAVARPSVHPGGAHGGAGQHGQPGTGDGCRSRPIRPEPTSSRRGCASTTTRTASSPSSTDPAASCAGAPSADAATPSFRPPREPLSTEKHS